MQLTQTRLARPHRHLGIRGAALTDREAHEAIMAPQIAAGTILARPFVPADVLVAPSEVKPGTLDGAVALGAWSAQVIELGGLVAARQGNGVGRRLLAAAEAEGRARGHRWMVALTGSPGFFEAHGYLGEADTPWLVARREGGHDGVVPIRSNPSLVTAVIHKAKTCAHCPRFAGCQQALLMKDLYA